MASALGKTPSHVTQKGNQAPLQHQPNSYRTIKTLSLVAFGALGFALITIPETISAELALARDAIGAGISFMAGAAVMLQNLKEPKTTPFVESQTQEAFARRQISNVLDGVQPNKGKKRNACTSPAAAVPGTLTFSGNSTVNSNALGMNGKGITLQASFVGNQIVCNFFNSTLQLQTSRPLNVFYPGTLSEQLVIVTPTQINNFLVTAKYLTTTGGTTYRLNVDNFVVTQNGTVVSSQNNQYDPSYPSNESSDVNMGVVSLPGTMALLSSYITGDTYVALWTLNPVTGQISYPFIDGVKITGSHSTIAVAGNNTAAAFWYDSTAGVVNGELVNGAGTVTQAKQTMIPSNVLGLASTTLADETIVLVWIDPTTQLAYFKRLSSTLGSDSSAIQVDPCSSSAQSKPTLIPFRGTEFIIGLTVGGQLQGYHFDASNNPVDGQVVFVDPTGGTQGPIALSPFDGRHILVGWSSNGMGPVGLQYVVNSPPSFTSPTSPSQIILYAGDSFTLTLPPTTDRDLPYGDATTNSVNGLTGWMTFNSSTQTATGTVPAGTAAGTYTLTPVVTDLAQATGDASSAAIIVRLPPEVVASSPISVRPGDFFSVPVASYFIDPQGNTLTYSETGSLPSGVTFANNQVFGALQTSGNYTLPVTATNTDGKTATAYVDIDVQQAAPAAPTITGTIPDETITAGNSASYTLPTNIFSSTVPLTYTATNADGTPLEPWISFNSTTLAFSWSPPLTISGRFQLAVQGRNPTGAAATAVFNLQVNAAVVVSNLPPVIDQVQDTVAFTFNPSTVQLGATDPENNPFVLDAQITGGNWATYNSATQQVVLSPGFFDYSATANVNVGCVDSVGNQAVPKTFKVSVQGIGPPQVFPAVGVFVLTTVAGLVYKIYKPWIDSNIFWPVFGPPYRTFQRCFSREERQKAVALQRLSSSATLPTTARDIAGITSLFVDAGFPMQQHEIDTTTLLEFRKADPTDLLVRAAPGKQIPVWFRSHIDQSSRVVTFFGSAPNETGRFTCSIVGTQGPKEIVHTVSVEVCKAGEAAQRRTDHLEGRTSLAGRASVLIPMDGDDGSSSLQLTALGSSEKDPPPYA